MFITVDPKMEGLNWIWSLQSSENWNMQLLFTHSLELGIIWNAREAHKIQKECLAERKYIYQNKIKEI